MRTNRFVVLGGLAFALGCSSDPSDGAGSGGDVPAATGGVGATASGGSAATGAATTTGGFGAAVGSGGLATGGAPLATGGLTATGGLPTGGAPTGGVAPTTGGAAPATGGSPPSAGGRATGGLPPATGGAPTGGAPTGGAPEGGTATGGTDPATGGEGGSSSDCPCSGRITYTLNRADSPTADELDAYDRLTVAMDEAIYYYNCYADLEKELWVNYDPGVPTAQANIDGWMSFGSDRAYMVLPTAMHETAHTLGIGYYGFGDMHDENGIWTGTAANAALAAIPNPRDTQLHADSMHFWPYGLNYASEYENEDDLINHVRIVTAIRLDLGL